MRNIDDEFLEADQGGQGLVRFCCGCFRELVGDNLHVRAGQILRDIEAPGPGFGDDRFATQGFEAGDRAPFGGIQFDFAIELRADCDVRQFVKQCVDDPFGAVVVGCVRVEINRIRALNGNRPARPDNGIRFGDVPHNFVEERLPLFGI